MDCRERILSNEYYDVITDFPFNVERQDEFDLCFVTIDNQYSLIYVNREGVQNLEENFFEYQRIPKLYAPMQEAFDSYDWYVSGILSAQRPPLGLDGSGVVICIPDSGIDYRNAAFLDENGQTRILAIWDQTIQTGTPPEKFPYGSVYTREDINRALQADNPYDIVPSRDETGHGTQMAGIACGFVENEYIGSAPRAQLVIIKLKEAKENLREFYLVAEGAVAYQENDILAALAFGDTYAQIFRRPVVSCLGVGTNQGDHNGSSVLSQYLNQLALRRSRAVVVCGGNEGNAGHHYQGVLRSTEEGGGRLTEEVELRIEEGVTGFVLEFWGNSPDIYTVEVETPGGERAAASPLQLQQSITYPFIYDDTILTVDSEFVEASSGEQLMLFRLENPTPGVWTFRVTARGAIYNGTFHMWLPVTSFLGRLAYFLEPNPFVTLTEPGMTREVITTSTYNAGDNSFYLNSGRGFTRSGAVKPELAAPGVNISTLQGKSTGSSLAAALTAGAVALFFQWAVIEGNNEVVETREIKNYLIRGAGRESDEEYPDRQWGYGTLDLYTVFDRLRG